LKHLNFGRPNKLSCITALFMLNSVCERWDIKLKGTIDSRPTSKYEGNKSEESTAAEGTASECDVTPITLRWLTADHDDRRLLRLPESIRLRTRRSGWPRRPIGTVRRRLTWIIVRGSRLRVELLRLLLSLSRIRRVAVSRWRRCRLLDLFAWVIGWLHVFVPADAKHNRWTERWLCALQTCRELTVWLRYTLISLTLKSNAFRGAATLLNYRKSFGKTTYTKGDWASNDLWTTNAGIFMA
jgi:hypothetical protein